MGLHVARPKNPKRLSTQAPSGFALTLWKNNKTVAEFWHSLLSQNRRNLGDPEGGSLLGTFFAVARGRSREQSPCSLVV